MTLFFIIISPFFANLYPLYHVFFRVQGSFLPFLCNTFPVMCNKRLLVLDCVSGSDIIAGNQYIFTQVGYETQYSYDEGQRP